MLPTGKRDALREHTWALFPVLCLVTVSAARSYHTLSLSIGLVAIALRHRQGVALCAREVREALF